VPPTPSPASKTRAAQAELARLVQHVQTREAGTDDDHVEGFARGGIG
jgi:hypothetical protein